MSPRLTKWIVILILVASITGLGTWLGYHWGASDKQAEMAEAREDAIRDAVEKDRAERSRLEERARAQERDQLSELREKLDTLRERDQAVDEYRRTQKAGECGLSDEALELYRRY